MDTITIGVGAKSEFRKADDLVREAREAEQTKENVQLPDVKGVRRAQRRQKPPIPAVSNADMV